MNKLYGLLLIAFLPRNEKLSNQFIEHIIVVIEKRGQFSGHLLIVITYFNFCSNGENDYFTWEYISDLHFKVKIDITTA